MYKRILIYYFKSVNRSEVPNSSGIFFLKKREFVEVV